MASIYCIDSCSLMSAMRDTYPISTFGSLWEELGKSFEDGILISTQIVYEEIETGDDELLNWAEAYKPFFLRVDESLVHEVATVVTKYPTLIDHTSPREQADPYLIGLAKLKSGIVVTEERFVGDNARRIKIPNVCKSEGIESIRLIEMIKRMNWKF